jgi:hypothetical protein
MMWLPVLAFSGIILLILFSTYTLLLLSELLGDRVNSSTCQYRLNALVTPQRMLIVGLIVMFMAIEKWSVALATAPLLALIR